LSKTRHQLIDGDYIQPQVNPRTQQRRESLDPRDNKEGQTSRLESREVLLSVVLVVPVHNEEDFIEQSIRSLEDHIKMMNRYRFSIILAEDGSTDKTKDIINSMARIYQNIDIRCNKEKLGRGKAVREAWKENDADIYCFLDADMATNLSYLNTLLDGCRRGFDLSTGSRYIESAEVDRPFLRKIVSKCYNLIINILYGTSARDHQCGFKAVTRGARDVIIRYSKSDDWFWDTELFVIARRYNLNVYEFPIEWHERRGAKTPVIRLMKDIVIHGSGIIKLHLQKDIN
jgi:glycosyltransferase involved in cell wall biosynthesis